MDFRDYTYVQAIAQYKNVSKAAEALYLSQPSLSKFLKKLEDRIGTPLFQRVNKQMIPTYAGEQFLAAGMDIFLRQNQLSRTLEQIKQETAGQLSIAITATRGYYVLTEILPEFKKQYPSYHIEILERNVDEVEQSLRSGEADFAVYSLSSHNPEFHNYIVSREEVVLCLPHNSPYLPFSISKEGFKYPWLDLAYLKNEVCFLNDSAQWMIGRLSRQLLREAGIAPEITTLRSLETCLALACRGLGFTFTFDISITCFKNYSKPPVYLSCGDRPYQADFVIARRLNYTPSRAEQTFINLVQQRFSSQIFTVKND